MIRFTLFLAAFLACVIFAFRAGGPPERAAAAAQVAALCLTWLTGYSSVFGHFGRLAVDWLVTDMLLLVALTCIALRANRLWPLVLAGLQEAAIFAHLVKGIYPGFAPMAYALLLQMWAWPMLLTTALGTRHHQLRKQRGFLTPDWKPIRPNRSLPAQAHSVAHEPQRSSSTA